MRHFIFLFFFISSTATFSQESILKKEWVSNNSVSDFFKVVKSEWIETPSATSLYVCGLAIDNNGYYDILIVKYNLYGSVLWYEQFDGNGNEHDIVTDMYIDENEYIYITGSSYTSSNQYDIITQKYNSSGTLQWEETYSGNTSLEDSGGGIVTDSNDNVYVCGAVYDNSTYYDFVTLKYNSSGTLQWDETYDHDGQMDGATRIEYKNQTNEVLVYGAGQTGTDEWRFVTVGYTDGGTYLGNFQSGYTSDTPTDVLGDLTRDNLGNFYVTGTVEGTSNNDIRTLKFDNTLQLQWEETFNGPDDLDDFASAIDIDDNGNIYVTGFVGTSNQGTDFVLIKYDGSGNEDWIRYYNGYGSGADTATSLVVGLNGDNHLYVAGSSFNGDNSDYHSIIYNFDGDTIAEVTFDQGLCGDDFTGGIAWAGNGEFVVSGSSWNGSSFELTNVKYSIEDAIDIPDFNANSRSISFVQNNGQLINTNGNSIPEIKYKSLGTYPSMFISDTSFSYVPNKVDTTGADTLHRIDFVFSTFNSPTVTNKKRRSEYSNYYKDTIARTMTPHFEELYSTDVWRLIDVEYSSSNNGIDVSFIAKSEFANMGSIQIDVNGSNGLNITGDDLIIETSINEIYLPQAIAWQIDGNGDPDTLTWQPDYNLNGNTLTFTNIGSYNTSEPLIFTITGSSGTPLGRDHDNLDWSTHFGGNDWDELIDVKTSGQDVWITGYTNSIDFPVQNGFQEVLNGSFDAIVSKFSESGQLIWSTYYGGTGDEGTNLHQSITVNSTSNEVTLFGRTSSQDLFLSQMGNAHYDNTNDCSLITCWDTFIARFSNSGTLTWGTYFGGNGGDGWAYSSTQDQNGNLYIVGSDNNVPLEDPGLPGHYQTTASGEGFITKFSEDGEILWSTYFGGSNGLTKITNIELDSKNDIIITGVTSTTSNFPLVDLGGYYQNTFGGGAFDAFIAKFNNIDYENIWATYFGGQGLDNMYAGLTVDKTSDDIYICGCTDDETNFPLYDSQSGGYFEDQLSGTSTNNNLSTSYCNGDAFISKFETDGDLIHSTLFGGESIDMAMELFSFNNNIYSILYTASDDLDFANPNLSDGYTQENHADGSDQSYDVFLLTFDNDFNLQWTTYFGGETPSSVMGGMDIPYGISINDNYKMFIVGSTISQVDFPLIDPGAPAWYDDNNLGSVSGFISRFDLLGTPLTTSDFNSILNDENIIMYPNPTNDILHIRLINSEKSNTKVYDITGKIIHQEKNNTNLFTLNLSNYPKGVYLINVETNNYSITRKIILR